MKRSDFISKIAIPTITQVEELLSVKGDEYATTGAFHTFNEGVNVSRISTTPIQVLEGFMLKHQVSLNDILDHADQCHLSQSAGFSKTPKEKIDEKIGDLLVYTILLKGMLYEIYGYDK